MNKAKQAPAVDNQSAQVGDMVLCNSAVLHAMSAPAQYRIYSVVAIDYDNGQASWVRLLDIASASENWHPVTRAAESLAGRFATNDLREINRALRAIRRQAVA